MEEEFKNTYSVIPTIILDDSELTESEKILYAHIAALSNKYGYCFASNAYLAQKMKKAKSTIKKWLKNLIDKKHLISEVVYKENSKEIKERKLRLTTVYGIQTDTTQATSVAYPGYERSLPGLRNEPDNNISINNISLINKEKEIYKEKERFVPPTLEEVIEYCKERKNNIDPKRFFDYYNVSNWKDGKGEPVKSWKQRIITWEGRKKQMYKQEIEDTSPHYKEGCLTYEEYFDLCFMNGEVPDEEVVKQFFEAGGVNRNKKKDD